MFERNDRWLSNQSHNSRHTPYEDSLRKKNIWFTLSNGLDILKSIESTCPLLVRTGAEMSKNVHKLVSTDPPLKKKRKCCNKVIFCRKKKKHSSTDDKL